MYSIDGNIGTALQIDGTICFTMCLCIRPDLDGYSAPKLKPRVSNIKFINSVNISDCNRRSEGKHPGLPSEGRGSRHKVLDISVPTAMSSSYAATGAGVLLGLGLGAGMMGAGYLLATSQMEKRQPPSVPHAHEAEARSKAEPCKIIEHDGQRMRSMSDAVWERWVSSSE